MEVEVLPAFSGRVHFWETPSYVRLSEWHDLVRVLLGNAFLSAVSLISEREGSLGRPSRFRPDISPAYEAAGHTLLAIWSE